MVFFSKNPHHGRFSFFENTLFFGPPCTYFYSEWKNDLKYIRIWFDTPTINKITKDRAAKFVDMLSAIGGTMGLLTGFSLISAVEIIVFASKLFWKKRNIFREMLNTKLIN